MNSRQISAMIAKIKSVEKFSRNPGDGKAIAMRGKEFRELFNFRERRYPHNGEELIIDGIRIKAV